MPSEQSTAREATHLVAETLRGYTFRFTDENELQEGVFEALGAGATREYMLDGETSRTGRIDFIVWDDHNIGVETKIAQAAPEVGRQVRRYLQSDEIDGLVLLTTRRRHRTLAFREFDKPVEIVWLGTSGF